MAIKKKNLRFFRQFCCIEQRLRDETKNNILKNIKIKIYFLPVFVWAIFFVSPITTVSLGEMVAVRECTDIIHSKTKYRMHTVFITYSRYFRFLGFRNEEIEVHKYILYQFLLSLYVLFIFT